VCYRLRRSLYANANETVGGQSSEESPRPTVSSIFAASFYLDSIRITVATAADSAAAVAVERRALQPLLFNVFMKTAGQRLESLDRYERARSPYLLPTVAGFESINLPALC
jgi:hypothetical protein